MNAKLLLGCGVAAAALLSPASASAQQVSFNIPAGPLPSAIAAFGRQSGLQIIAPADGMGGVRSNMVRGRMDAGTAVRRLIAGTGLAIASESGGQIVLRQVTRPAAPKPAASQTTSRTSSEAQTGAGDDIVVTGLRASLQTAREIKRNSDAVVDAVAAEDLNQLPDNSATEALARLPGVQVLRFRGEAQGFTVRGLSQVLTTVNGQEAYYGTSRQSLLNSYPASLIASAEVYKALTPDLIEGGLGGAVNINFRRPLDYKRGLTVAGTLRGTTEDQDHKFYYNGDVLLNGRWDTGIGELGVLVNASYMRRDYLESYRQNLSPTATTVAPASPAGLAKGLIIPVGMLIRHNEGNYRRPVLTAAAQWRPAPNFDVDARVTHVIDKNEYTDNYLATSLMAQTVLSDVVLVPDTNIVKSATFTPSNARGPYSSHTKLDIKTTQVDIGAAWRTGIAKLSTRAVYTTSVNDTYAQNVQLAFRTAPRVRADFQSDAQYGGLAYQYLGVDLEDPANFYLASYADGVTRNKGGGLQWRTDLELTPDAGFFSNIKAGFRYADRSAHFRSGSRTAAFPTTAAARLPLSAIPGGDALKLVASGFGGDNADVPSSWIGYDGSLLGRSTTTEALNRYLTTSFPLFATQNPAINPIQTFDGKETSYAAYGQFKYNLSLASIPVDGVIGARIVNTQLAIDGTRGRTTRLNPAPANPIVYEPIHSRQNYLDFDPSASAVAHFADNVQMRLTWTKTFSRPDFSQLNPSTTLTEAKNGDAYVGFATKGNPDLQPVRSQNWDASLEWYFGRAGALSVAGFKRDIDGFIVSTQERQDLEGALGAVDVTQPINAGKGTVKGVEISGSTFFDFAPGILRNFGVSANFTYADSHQVLPTTKTNVGTEGPIAGVSKTSFNAAAFYDDSRLRIRIAYAKRSKFLLAYNTASRPYDQYYYPIERLDFSVGYKIMPGTSITIDGTNLLNMPQHGYYGTPQFVDRVYYEGRTFSAALRFAF
ncbi:TonB-dependent receptor [Sphingomonas endolithica]|uniref:TonB-dependent receptor n=1 Tax=Sphingomonas endolithica TaxID=2972485 RepID=UPI0021AFB973|nr:TonB-dependent receptor [Sphingomonas sp. ZFBP2030]